MSAAVADLDAPAVVAEKVARIQSQIDRWALVAILLGLAFTMVNVQTFAAAGALIWTLPWLAAWLLDPMVSILLLVVVRAEQVTARWQVKMAWQVTATKWVAFAATYVMNTWEPWQSGVAASIVLHSVPPVFVLMGAEVLPALRKGLTEAVLKARAYADDGADDAAETGLGPLDLPPLTPPPGGPAAGPATEGGEPTSSPTLGDRPAPSATTEAVRAWIERGAVSTTAVKDTGAGIGADPAVRASVNGTTDRLLEHHPPLPSHAQPRPAPWELPATLVDDVVDVVDVVDETAGQSPVPAPPVEVKTPITDTPAEPGPGATTDQAPPTPYPATDTSPGADDPADPDAVTGEDLEPRVLLLVERLRTNPELTGPDAEAALEAAGFGPVAARTARRLLSKAREALPSCSRDPQGSDSTTDNTGSDSADLAADHPAGPADSADSAPDGLAPALQAPTGTDTGRALALVRPAAGQRPGDH